MSDLRLISHETGGCVCYPEGSRNSCVCDDDERLIRSRLYHIAGVPPFTKGEREKIARDADYMAKGEKAYNDLLRHPDADLAWEWLDACQSFARKHGLR